METDPTRDVSEVRCPSPIREFCVDRVGGCLGPTVLHRNIGVADIGGLRLRFGQDEGYCGLGDIGTPPEDLSGEGV
jgi:hypothetical protein